MEQPVGARLQQASNIIELPRGQELAIFDEQDICDQGKLMYPAFSSAVNAVEGVLSNSRAWNLRYAGQFDQPGGNDFSDGLYGYANNILAFCASRGQGKTSAMLSFSRALGQYRYGQGRHTKALESALKESRFFILPPIDPTMLEVTDSVIELILGRLLNEINRLWASGSETLASQRTYSVRESEKIEILAAFNICVDGLRSGRRRSSEGYAMHSDALSRANDIYDVKRSLLTIVRYFLRLYGLGTADSYIVVQLDDTDMQMGNTYRILEEVRKHLAIPNVIVLMAADMVQLRAVVERHYARELGTRNGFLQTHHLAVKYVDKLIPSSHTIYLPTIKQQWETSSQTFISIRDNSGSGNESESNGASREELENCIFRMIYEKTGLAFVRHESYIHDIIPSTLRGTLYLYRLLDRMDKPMPFAEVQELLTGVPESSEKKRTALSEYFRARMARAQAKLNNLIQFENYFLNDWVPSRLVQVKHQRTFAELEQTHSLHLIQRLFAVFPKADEQPTVGIGKSVGFFELLAAFSQENPAQTKDGFRFCFALRTFLSILLNKLVCADELREWDKWMSLISKDNITGEPITIEYKYLTSKYNKSVSEPQAADWRGITEKLTTAANSMVALESEGSENTYHDSAIRFLETLMQILQYTGEKKPYLEYSAKQKADGALSAYVDMFRLQEYMLYICCNWDVQHQFLDNIVKYITSDTDTSHDENEELEGVGKYLKYFVSLMCDKQAVGPEGNFSKDNITSYINGFITSFNMLLSAILNDAPGQEQPQGEE